MTSRAHRNNPTGIDVGSAFLGGLPCDRMAASEEDWPRNCDNLLQDLTNPSHGHSAQQNGCCLRNVVYEHAVPKCDVVVEHSTKSQPV